MLIETYADLVANFVARRHQLGLSQAAVDHIAGWPDSYCSKVEISAKPNRARNARAIGQETLPLITGALGVRLMLVDDGKCRLLTHAEHALSLATGNLLETAIMLSAGSTNLEAEPINEIETTGGDELAWSDTLRAIREMAEETKANRARVAAAEERAKRAEKRAAHAEHWLQKLHQAVLKDKAS
ncbi:hypothetical protein [Methylobacterium iners]|uniref:XRE family transcriptional regulator n=1 Tax=Methylobacterium iners TaxID=418707 RepID=A0ABQ4RWZ4_9HYPH|nr:hypothetical protein [Methylobacterium iners]GJD94143.1 hypothetical protein OCOJLMKI_1345 [Methylobacterium iners]